MKKIKFTLLMTTALLIGACATNYEEEKTVLMAKNDTPDLVSSFEAEKEQAQIFTTETPKKEVTIPEKKKRNQKVMPATKTAPAVKEKAPEKKPESTPVAPAVIPPVTSSEFTVPNNVAPADYPEEFKAYDAKSKAVWEKFKPIFNPGEQSIMAVTYLGVTAGHITIQSKEITTLNNKPAYHFYARFKSSDSYRYFYWLDDRLDSYVEKQTFLPMKYSLIQREKKQNVDDLQLFDFKKAVTLNWYKRVKEGSNKDEKGETKIPLYAQDSFSALQFVRGLPLIKGDVYELPVITRGKFWILKAEVMGEETTSVNGKDMKAIKIKAETNFPGVLKKSGDINFWYGADADRRLLKFQAKIKLGSLYGEVVEFTPGTKVQ